jgi:hypothetical protein
MTKFASTKGGIAIGLKGKRGHVVTRRTPRAKPSKTKGVRFCICDLLIVSIVVIMSETVFFLFFCRHAKKTIVCNKTQNLLQTC